MQEYERTENGTTTRIPLAQGRRVIEQAQMEGKRFVRTMSAGRDGARIEYKNGITITLRRVEMDAVDESAEWSGTHSKFAHLHRFDRETLRGRCNKRIRPGEHANGYAFKTRAEVDAKNEEFPGFYTLCPRCSAH